MSDNNNKTPDEYIESAEEFQQRVSKCSEAAEKYGRAFEELKEVNPELVTDIVFESVEDPQPKAGWKPVDVIKNHVLEECVRGGKS